MEHLSPEQYRFFRRTVIQIVLATDMAGHSELLQASLNLLLPPPLPAALHGGITWVVASIVWHQQP